MIRRVTDIQSQRHLLPPRRRQRLRRLRSHLALHPPPAIQLEPTLPRHAPRSNLLLRQQRLPRHRTFRAARRRCFSLRNPTLLLALRGWHRHHCGGWCVLADLGYRVTQVGQIRACQRDELRRDRWVGAEPFRQAAHRDLICGGKGLLGGSPCTIMHST